MDIPNWQVVLYDLNEQPILDISRFTDIDLDLKLNENSVLTFDLSLVQFEKACEKIGADPQGILYPAKTEVKVFRNNNAIFGGIVAAADTELSKAGGTISVTVDSYIQYFEDRLLTKNYINTDRSQIAWDAIDTAQSEPHGDLGVTKGNLAVKYKSELTADLRSIKDIIQLYTRAVPDTYDFEITPDKVFNTYDILGSYRPEYPLVYPQNIKSLGVPRNSDSLFNKIYGIGAGIGDERIETTKSNVASQLEYRLRESKRTFNSVSELTTLEHNTEGYLNEHYGVLVVPSVVLDSKAIDLDVVKVGDVLPVRVDGHSYLRDVAGDFRIYGMKISVDRHGHEQVTLDFYKPDAGGELE